MPGVTLFCFLASYILAFLLELGRVFRPMQWLRLSSFGASLAGLLAHTIYLVNRSQNTDLPPLIGSSHDWILVLAWLVVVASVMTSLVSLLRKQDLSLDLFGLPLAVLLVFVAKYSSQDPNLILQQLSTTKMVHSAALVLGVGGVSIGFLLSVMYLWQHRRLKAKRFGGLQLSLPSLESLARLNYWSIMVSIPMLTIGMGTGVILAVMTKGTPQAVSLFDPYILAYVMTWALMFALFAWVLISRHQQGRQVAMLTAWAFGFLLVSMVGLQLMSGLIKGAGGWHG